MMLFWGIASALILLALLFLLPALLRRGTPSPPRGGVRQSNLPILREQLEQLDAELAAGGLDAEQQRVARTELQRRVLEETAVSEQLGTVEPARKTAVLLALCVPLLAAGLYATLGNLPGLAPVHAVAASSPENEFSMQQIEAMVDKLAQRLEREPDNVEGWTMLARSYVMLQRFPQASQAYARAIALAHTDAQLLADQANVLAVVQGQSFAGEPTRLLEKALQLAPDNLKALALAGSAAFERGDHVATVAYWSRALKLVPPGSEFANHLERSLERARAAASSPQASAGAAQGESGASNGFVSGRIRLAPALAARVAPTDTVFIFARAAEGPRMPLAVLRRSASELPISFTLDDSMAMSAQLKLSNFESVVVAARVSKTGDAAPQPGDLQGQIGPVKVGRSDLEVVIDSVRP